MKTLALLLVCLGAEGGDCARVAGDHFLAGELSALAPALASLNPEEPLGVAPAPGSRRLLHSRELILIARKHGLPQEVFQTLPAELCLERVSEILTQERLVAALEEALALPAAKLDLLDYSRIVAPVGRLEFSRSALAPPPSAKPDGAVIWRGRLVYGEQRSLAVWAKVRIQIDVPAVVAAAPLRPGQIIERTHVRQVQRKRFPFSPAPLDSLEQAIGKTVLRSFAAGDVIPASALAEAREISAGETVRVTALSGSAQIHFEARAQTGGRKGDTILLENPGSGRRFRARVMDKKEAQVRASGA
jgi:flagella basal body P-ring formation protein FlgA